MNYFPINYIVKETASLGPKEFWKPEQMDRITIMLAAIGFQESRFEHRAQIGHPELGRGFWQFEMNGIIGVRRHKQTRLSHLSICRDLLNGADDRTVHLAIAFHDILACYIARELLWTDPAPLPQVGEQDVAWEYYERNWKPGTPRPDEWPESYRFAMSVIGR